MRHSLLLRLLGLSLAVAMFAIAATAWLINRDTSERFRGEFERTLEADNFIYQELIAYASRNDSWAEVGQSLAELAERTGRRVALTSLDGDMIADSAVTSGHPAPGLASNPTAEIDALAAQVRGTATTYVGFQGDTFVAESSDATAAYESRILPEATWSPAGQLAVSAVTATGISPVWRMAPDEAQSRLSLAVDAQRCLQDELDTDDEIVVTPNGEVVVFGQAYAAQLSGERLSDDDVGVATYGMDTWSFGSGENRHPCLPAELFSPSEAALEFNTEETRLLKECLEDQGVSYRMVDVESGLKRLVPDVPGEDALNHFDGIIWADCEHTAWTAAMDGFVADPALLYTGDNSRFDPFFGDGWWRTLLAGAAVLIVATGVTVLAGRRLTRPIRALTAAAQRMGAGDHGARVEIHGGDEVARLAGAFNSMAASIETSAAQRRAMISDVAHELRTPLANVRGYLEAAEDGVVPLDPALVTSLLEESALLQRLIDDLQELALADAGMLRIHPEPRPAGELVRQVVAAHRMSADDAGVSLVAEPAEDWDDGNSVCVDPARIRQALGNLVANAIRFTPPGGVVTVSVRRDGASVLFTVTDDGPGIAPEHLPRLFDRFYRVEGSRSRETGGSGLGLAITKHLVEAHGGGVEVTSIEGVGSVFTIRLPLRQAAPVA